MRYQTYNITGAAAYPEALEASLGTFKFFLERVRLLQSWPISSQYCSFLQLYILSVNFFIWIFWCCFVVLRMRNNQCEFMMCELVMALLSFPFHSEQSETLDLKWSILIMQQKMSFLHRFYTYVYHVLALGHWFSSKVTNMGCVVGVLHEFYAGRTKSVIEVEKGRGMEPSYTISRCLKQRISRLGKIYIVFCDHSFERNF